VQVEALEHDKHVITDAFERVLASLQASFGHFAFAGNCVHAPLAGSLDHLMAHAD